MNWQPIETAPKDGTNVLLYREAGNLFIVGYFDQAHGWVDGECIAPVLGLITGANWSRRNDHRNRTAALA